MAKLFGFGGDDGATREAQTTQRRAQQRQSQRIAVQEGEEAREIGARRRLLQARATGGSGTLFGAPAGVSPTLG